MLRDKNRREIMPGDLLRSFHFRDRRRRNNYLYHVAVSEGENLRAVPVSHLNPAHRLLGGGNPLLTPGLASCVEIIGGTGNPSSDDWWRDRPKQNGGDDANPEHKDTGHA